MQISYSSRDQISDPLIALKSIYPEHNWDEIKLHKPRNYWTLEKQRSFFEHLAKRLSIQLHITVDHRGDIQSLDDWNHVSIHDVHNHGGGSILQLYYSGSLVRGI